MQLRIVHTTGFEYAGKAVASYNQARLTPQTSTAQLVVHTRIEVSPTPWIFEYRDYFGNEVTAFEVLDPHEELTVVADSTVHTQPLAPAEPTLQWSDLETDAVADRWTEYLGLPDLVEPAEDFAARVAGFRDLARPGEAARAVCDVVNKEMKYVSGSTDAATPAADAWAQRAGVCQDMAHVALGGMRSLGIPARYVSGYLHPKEDAVVGETVAGESHAWVEWWDDGWHAFDPTNDLEPSERWVVAATGRDYLDVRPLSGIFSGGGTSSMFVQVDITRLA